LGALIVIPTLVNDDGSPAMICPEGMMCDPRGGLEAFNAYEVLAADPDAADLIEVRSNNEEIR